MCESDLFPREDLKKYQIPLKKEDLVEACIKYNKELEANGVPQISFSLGIPQRLLKTLSQYFDKKQEKISVLNLIVMYESIGYMVSGQEIEDGNFKRWKTCYAWRNRRSSYH